MVNPSSTPDTDFWVDDGSGTALNTKFGKLITTGSSTATLAAYGFASSPGTGLKFGGFPDPPTRTPDWLNILSFMTAGSERLRLLESSGFRLVGLGSAAIPSLAFASDTNTGVYCPAAGLDFHFVTGGATALAVTPVGALATANVRINGVSGTVGSPAWSFSSDTGTGAYLPVAGEIAFATSGVQRMRLTASGVIAMSAAAEPAVVNGAIYYNSTDNEFRVCEAGTWLAMGDSLSSGRFKQEVHPWGEAFLLLEQLEPSRWNRTGELASRGQDLGLVAEQVAVVLPEIVGRDSDGQPASLDYGKLSSLLAKGIQEQDREIRELNQKLDELLEKAFLRERSGAPPRQGD